MITDPEIVRFVNEEIRPMAEQLRAIKAKSAQLVARWFGNNIANRVPNDSTALDDGREAEGASRLTGADITNMVGQLANISSQYNADIIEKPCVRTFTAS